MTDVDNPLFLDTNILLAATDSSRRRHESCQRWLESGLSGSSRLILNGQVIREYLVVATRPVEVNGLGIDPEDALENVSEFLRATAIIDENSRTCNHLRVMVLDHDLIGKRIHDANLVATMRTHGIRRLLTDNPNNFKSFHDIEVITPE